MLHGCLAVTGFAGRPERSGECFVFCKECCSGIRVVARLKKGFFAGQVYQVDIIGIGTDSIEIARVRLAIERAGKRFLKRVFTESEQACCDARRDRFACYAARFAAKEAVLKAIGTGLAGCRWTDIEIRRRAGESPEVAFSGRAAELAGKKGVAGTLVNFSHDRERAVAFALATGAEGEI